MIEQFKDFPICVNCKYYLEEKTGPMQIMGTCGLTMVDPVTGEFADRVSRVKLAAAYRKDSMPCGPSGKFFQPGKKKVEPKKKPVEVKEAKESNAKVISVEVPEMRDIYTHIDPKPLTKKEQELLASFDGSPSDLDPNGVDDVVTTVVDKFMELPDPEPKKRRRRAK